MNRHRKTKRPRVRLSIEHLESRSLLAALFMDLGDDFHNAIPVDSEFLLESSPEIFDHQVALDVDQQESADDYLDLNIDWEFDFVEQPTSPLGLVADPFLEEPWFDETPDFDGQPTFERPPNDLPPNVPGSTQPPEPLPHLPLAIPRTVLPPVIVAQPTETPEVGRTTQDVIQPIVAQAIKTRGVDLAPGNPAFDSPAVSLPHQSSPHSSLSVDLPLVDSRLSASPYFTSESRNRSFTWKLGTERPAQLRRIPVPVAVPTDEQETVVSVVAPTTLNRGPNRVPDVVWYPSVESGDQADSQPADQPIMLQADDEEATKKTRQSRMGAVFLLASLYLRHWHSRRQTRSSQEHR